MSESKERTHEPAQEAESKIDIFELLYDYLRGLKKIWWLIPVLVCLFGGLLYARDVMRYQPMYKSQASFTVSTVTASGNSYSYSFYYDTSTVKQMASTFPYILESNLLIDLVKNDLGVEYINGAISVSYTHLDVYKRQVDVRDPANPTLVAEFPYPEVPEDFPYPNFNVMNLECQGPFGPHNLHEPMSNKPWLEQRGDRVYCCYFAAGLRIYDVSDQYYIKEIAYFIPPNPNKTPEESFFKGFPGPRNAVTEDCCVDDRGYIYVTCLDDGFYVLKRTGAADNRCV